jgi:hypothetical protein
VKADTADRQLWADAVEKGGGAGWNATIIRVDFLNRTCTIDHHFESMLLRDPSNAAPWPPETGEAG